MSKKSYVTNMPDKTGAFLIASRIIAKHNGNIVRVSYNKAVDLHTLFIDVEAEERNLCEITKELERVGYLNKLLPETTVIIVEITIPDISGAVLPVLKILDRYEVNISYINSVSTDMKFQRFKMGLLIENPKMIKMLLDEISELYQINILDYNRSEENLDNTIFYIRLANEMQKLLGLSTEKTMEFISESNRIFQMLQEKGENPDKVFDFIRRFAYFISRHRNHNFKADIQKINITGSVALYSIQPPCGSNTYILASENELMLIDTGYTLYQKEMFDIFHRLFPDWDKRNKRIYITHADVDHCGLLAAFDGSQVYLNQKSADGLHRQSLGIPDYRENNSLRFGYSRLSRIISGYVPPDTDKFNIIDNGTPEEHSDLLHLGDFSFAGIHFEVFEGSGGHLYGESIFLFRVHGILFTGDNLVNINGFSPERSEFNALAPYLMGSVNVDSGKATEMRTQIICLIEEVQKENGKPCMICGGHGPVSIWDGTRLVKTKHENILTF